MTDTKTLRELAEKATKGPWKTHLVDSRCVYAGNEHIASTVDSDDSSFREENDAAYIAAANPSAVIELLDELTRLRAQVERMREALEPFADWGLVFEKDDSPWGRHGDNDEIQLGATRQHGWAITVGQFRAARAAMEG